MNVKSSAYKRKAYRKKNVVKKRRVYRKRLIAPTETACVKQTLELNDLEPNTPYEPELTLPLAKRALDIADNYQEYRISKVEYIYKPLFDTFQSQYQPGSNVNPSVPYLYAKQLSYPAPTTFGLNFLQTLGVKPRRLDDKNVIVKYRPHILQGGLSALSQGTTTQNYTRAIKSPWLNTHVVDSAGNTLMDSTIHYGHVFWINQEVTNPDTTKPVCAFDVNVYFEFRKPWDLAAQTPPAGTPDKENPFTSQ